MPRFVEFVGMAKPILGHIDWPVPLDGLIHSPGRSCRANDLDRTRSVNPRSRVTVFDYLCALARGRSRLTLLALACLHKYLEAPSYAEFVLQTFPVVLIIDRSLEVATNLPNGLKNRSWNVFGEFEAPI